MYVLLFVCKDVYSRAGVLWLEAGEKRREVPKVRHEDRSAWKRRLAVLGGGNSILASATQIMTCSRKKVLG